MKTVFKWSDEQFKTFVECYKAWENKDNSDSERIKNYDKCIEILTSIYPGKIIKFVTDDDCGTLEHIFKISYVKLRECGEIDCYGVSLITNWRNDCIISIGCEEFNVYLNKLEEKYSIGQFPYCTEISEDEFNQEYTRYMDNLQKMLELSSTKN